MALEDYAKAKKAGDKAFRRAVSEGRYPYLPALDQIVPVRHVLREETVGLCEIPTANISGTVTKGRREAFADNFMPILTPDSEFAAKWIHVYEYQIREGIQDPVKVYELLGRFYVAEGNKRVSVLRYLKQPYITAEVVRVIPPDSDSEEMRSYKEFLRFFSCTGLYDIVLLREGGYKELAGMLSLDLEQPFPEEQIRLIKTAYARFSEVYQESEGKALRISEGEAFLIYCRFFKPDSLTEDNDPAIHQHLKSIMNELRIEEDGNRIFFQEQPSREKKKTIVDTILGKKEIYTKDNPLKAAFIYDGSPDTSRWIYGHENGRLVLEEEFAGLVCTKPYPGCDTEEKFENAAAEAAHEGAKLVITTSPVQMEYALRASVAYPDIHFINCSVHMPHKAVRTYYGRMFEAKFVLGAIAASLAEDHQVGYVSDYPICGTVANINAFAIGAAMIDPKIRIYLTWSCQKDQNWRKFMEKKGLRIISGPDLMHPLKENREYGLYGYDREGRICHYAMPEWNWGKYYSLIVCTILSQTWDKEENTAGNRGLNYWWGLSSGVIDVSLSEQLPEKTGMLANLLKQAIIKEEFKPFSGLLRDNRGDVQTNGLSDLSAEEIVNMNWLNENVDGTIPSWDELTDKAKRTVLANGIMIDGCPS